MKDLIDILELDAANGDPQARLIQILSEACRLFATRGFDGTSMRDIAAECGVSKPTLYHYFPDKDSILRPLVMGVTRSLYERVAASIQETDPPREKLRTFMVETARFFHKF